MFAMQRTLVLINNSSLGGAERRLGRLFARMADDDPRTLLIINAGLWRDLLAAGVVSGQEARVRRLPEPWRRLTKWVGLRQGRLAFLLRKLDFPLFSALLLVRYGLAPRRVFHLVLGGAYVALPLMLLRPDHHAVVSVVDENLARLVGVPWALPAYRFALDRCDVIDALTDGVRADLIQRGIAPQKILVSPGSVVDLDRFQPSPEKEPWVVFAGRLIEGKNPLLFVEAIPAILRAVPTARFFLLGDGPLRSLVEHALERLNLLRAVEIGFHPDPVPVFSRACVFASLQREDNYPSQSLLEAMACGAATVATDVGLTWKLVDETTGTRVKPNPDDIAEAVIGLLRDPQRCDRLGRAARRRVAEQHSKERYRTYLDTLYARAEA